MANINNPRKAFQFNIIIPGIPPFLVQTVKLPDVEFDTDEHGDANYKVKTAGMVNYTMLSIGKILNVDGIDNFIWQWVRDIQDVVTGGGQTPTQYKRLIIVEQFAPDGITVLERWQYDNCWPKRINGLEFSRIQSGNTMENIDFEVDRLLQ